MTIVATIIFVAALLAMCLAGMFWQMDRDERRLNAAALWAMAQAQVQEADDDSA